MRSHRFAILIVAALATVSAASACSRTGQAAGDLAPATAIGLSVYE